MVVSRAKWPNHPLRQHFGVSVSQTLIKRDRFHRFEGLDRILTVIEGKGMVLARNNGDLVADLHNPVHFSGSDKIDGLLPNGPIQDFNLIFDGSNFEADVSVSDTITIDIQPPSNLIMTLVYCLTGAFQVIGSNILLPHDGVMNPRRKITAVDRSSTALVIEISTKS